MNENNINLASDETKTAWNFVTNAELHEINDRVETLCELVQAVERLETKAQS